MNKLTQALGSGVAGACVLTAIHETARRVVPHAPRMDVMGERAIAAAVAAAGGGAPSEKKLYAAAMAGDLVSNGLFYALVAAGDRSHTWRRGTLLGLAAGAAALALPKVMGLGGQPGRRTPATQLMTMAWYLAGGLAAAATVKCMAQTVD